MRVIDPERVWHYLGLLVLGAALVVGAMAAVMLSPWWAWGLW